MTYYNSTGYKDELLWEASWFYHATKEHTYFKYATVQNGKAFANWGNPTWFSWDNKLAGTQVLLSRVSFFKAKGQSSSENHGLQMYRKTASAVMCGLLPDSIFKSVESSGLIWIDEWNALQHPVASAFLAVTYCDYMLTSRTESIDCSGTSYTPADLRKFAISQADYVFGKNPMKISFLVGNGSKYPEYVHHRGALIPADDDTGRKGFKWLQSTKQRDVVATMICPTT